MKIYLDVSCLNRPFDDQRQQRIRIEADAVLQVLGRIDAGEWRQVSSEMALIEADAMTDDERRRRVGVMLPAPPDVLLIDEDLLARGMALQDLGFGAGDAVHIAAAERVADIPLTCDDQMLRLARRHQQKLSVRVEIPVTFLKDSR